jgi:L-ascorbate metabolism protein UlaG (beta-lactamase superfamily)
VRGVRLTHSGGPTVLIEVEGWRLLTDPDVRTGRSTSGVRYGKRGGCGPGSLVFSAFGNQLSGAGHVFGRHDDSNAFSQLPLWFHATGVVS